MYIVIISKKFIHLLSKGKWNAWAFFPFVVFDSKESRNNPALLNHELIHHRQQLELVFVFFWILYGGQFLFNLLKYRNAYKAYRNVVFEIEAYENQDDLNYRKKRR